MIAIYGLHSHLAESVEKCEVKMRSHGHMKSYLMAVGDSLYDCGARDIGFA